VQTDAAAGGKFARMFESIAKRKERKAKSLPARQAPLPPGNLDLPIYRGIKKLDVVVLKNLDKSQHYMQGLEGVVRLIIKECPESYGNHKFMVELLDNQFFPQIEHYNKTKEARYEQTGHSRYGACMQLHYVICRRSQLTVKDGEAGAVMPSSPS